MIKPKDFMKQNSFKVGDKVKVPESRNGLSIDGWMSRLACEDLRGFCTHGQTIIKEYYHENGGEIVNIINHKGQKIFFIKIYNGKSIPSNYIVLPWTAYQIERFIK